MAAGPYVPLPACCLTPPPPRPTASVVVAEMASGRTALSRLPLRRFPFKTRLAHPSIRPFSTLQSLEPNPFTTSGSDPHFGRQIPPTTLLHRHRFPSSAPLTRSLPSNSFLSDSADPDVQRGTGVLLSLGLSQDSLLSLVASCPRVLEPGFLRKWEVGFSHLGLSPLPTWLVHKILEQSSRCRLEPEDVQRNVQVLRDVGFRDMTVVRILEELPTERFNLVGLNRKIRFLKEFGLLEDEIHRIVHLFPRFLAMSLEGRLLPLIEEFGELGLSRDEVRKAVVENPRILLTMEAGEPSRCVELLRSLRCRLPIKDKILCEGPIPAAIRVKLRVDNLCRHGLIRRDAFRVLWKEPRLILYELDDIEKKIEFLVHKMGFGVDWLVEVPEYLGVNFEKQVVPRYKVIEYLRSKGALGFQVDLRQLVRPSRMEFYNMFVKPYPECEKIFGGLQRDVKVKPKHPVGLWTLFKPQTYPQSKEDVNNMKLFMESLV